MTTIDKNWTRYTDEELDQMARDQNLYTLTEVLDGKTPMSHWVSHQGVQTFEQFEAFIRAERRECVRYHLVHDLGLVQWSDEFLNDLLIKCSVLGTVAETLRNVKQHEEIDGEHF